MTTFETSGLHCLLTHTPVGTWGCYVSVDKSHALYRHRRDVKIAMPASLAGRAINHSRVAAADMHGAVPATIDVGASLPASCVLECTGGIMFTGVLPDDPHWYIGFFRPGDDDAADVQKELEDFAAQVRSLADAKVTDTRSPFPEVPTGQHA